jgi:hypothetical protein
MQSQNQSATGSFNINDEVFKLTSMIRISNQLIAMIYLWYVPLPIGWNRQVQGLCLKCYLESFWYEGELCILFADSNLGKSILAVQIGNSINTGIATEPFPIEAEIKQAD